jgi:hypothetical protein
VRYPIAPLTRLAAARGITTNAELARVLGVTRRTVQRWHTTGLTDAAADAAAVALGVLPGDVWAEHRQRGIEAVDERRRALVAARQRRYRSRHPEYVEQVRQYSADYRRQYPEASRAYARSYYQRNRERMIRQAVERKQRRAAEKKAAA